MACTLQHIWVYIYCTFNREDLATDRCQEVCLCDVFYLNFISTCSFKALISKLNAPELDAIEEINAGVKQIEVAKMYHLAQSAAAKCLKK